MVEQQRIPNLKMSHSYDATITWGVIWECIQNIHDGLDIFAKAGNVSYFAGLIANYTFLQWPKTFSIEHHSHETTHWLLQSWRRWSIARRTEGPTQEKLRRRSKSKLLSWSPSWLSSFWDWLCPRKRGQRKLLGFWKRTTIFFPGWVPSAMILLQLIRGLIDS